MARKKKRLNKNGTIKKYKEECENYLKIEDYDNAFKIAENIIDKYPKNPYGYLSALNAKTKGYTLYIDDEELKKVKPIYENAKENIPNKQTDSLIEFEEYLADLREVENIKKIKKEITGKELLKLIYQRGINIISQNMVTLNSYTIDGKKIKNIYDFINGVYFLSCLIFNLIYRNYLLILTVPFGIFGLINIYSFINMNFLEKGLFRKDKVKVNSLLNSANEKIKLLNQRLAKNDENLKFLYSQKSSTLLKIPESFSKQLPDVLGADEELNANKLFNYMIKNDMISFTLELDKNTNINLDDINQLMKDDISNNDDELINYINSKMQEKKSKQSELLYAKKIGILNIILSIMFLLVSIFCFINLISNFYEVNLPSFIVGTISGILSTLIYSICNNKHKSFFDVASDNLLSTVFKASLSYDLVYISLTNELKFTYGFIQMPLIFTLTLIGIVMIISLLKYNYFLKTLSK